MALLPIWQQLWLHPQTQSSPILVLLLLLSIAFVLKIAKSRSKHKYPPSPPRLPFLGNLHQLGWLPHRSLQSLAHKYGPVMLLKLGHAPALVISSADLARDMLKIHDLVCSERPKSTVANILLYGGSDVSFSPYGEYWRLARKMSVVGLLSPNRVESLQSMREEEVEALVGKIREAVRDRSSVDLSSMLVAVSNNMVSRAVLGHKCEEDNVKSNFGELSRKLMIEFSSFCFGDMFPYLRWLDVLNGLISRLKSTSSAVDAFLDQVIEEHKVTLESDEVKQSPDRKDFVHILLDQLQSDGVHLTLDNLKAILLNMFLGGSDTTSTTMEWTMAELMKNPSKMKKVQEEVRRVVGKKLKVEMSDVNQMGFLKCVIKETLRMHPPAPLVVRSHTKRSPRTVLGGYEVPERVSVFINVWAIQRDPTLWDRPHEFLPERFENCPVDFKGQDFQFIPFGAGRRGCPGMTFGVVAAEFIVANLLYWFNWDLCDGLGAESLDMSEVFGLTLSKKFPLQLVPQPHTSCS